MRGEDKVIVTCVVTFLLAALCGLASCHARTPDAIRACREACNGKVRSADITSCRCRYYAGEDEP